MVTILYLHRPLDNQTIIGIPLVTRPLSHRNCDDQVDNTSSLQVVEMVIVFWLLVFGSLIRQTVSSLVVVPLNSNLQIFHILQ